MNLGRSLRTSKENREHQGVPNIDFEIMQASTVSFLNLSPQQKHKKQREKMCPTAAPSCLVHSCTVGEPPRFAAVERLNGRFSGCHGKTCHCTASGLTAVVVAGWGFKVCFAWRRKGGTGVDVVRYPLRIYHIYMENLHVALQVARRWWYCIDWNRASINLAWWCFIQQFTGNNCAYWK